MRKLLILLTVVAVVLGAAVVAIVVSAPSSAEADDDETVAAAALQEDSESEPGDSDDEEAESRAAGKSGIIEEVLDELVADDVITQEQAEAVADALHERFADHKPDGFQFREFPFRGFEEFPFEEFPFDEVPELDELRERFGDFRFEFRGLGRNLDAIVDVLGGDLGVIIDGVLDGKTLAEIAEENGSSGQEVVDAIVDAARERLTDAVAAGRITQERADEMLADMAESAEQLVNEQLGPNGLGFGWHDGGFRFGDRDQNGENAGFRLHVNV